MKVVREALIGRICVQAWIGLGTVLIIGFGESPLPERTPGRPREVPPYQLKAIFSEWTIEAQNQVLGSSPIDPIKAQSVAMGLVGRRILRYRRIDARAGLEITFQDDLRLRILAMDDQDPKSSDA